jgi:glycosyltransferase involved in cell wall biosynthesis
MNEIPQVVEIRETTEKLPQKLRVAIVHYWFVGRAGGEKVVEALAEMFPQADIFSPLIAPSTLSPILRSRKLQTSFLQRVPGSIRFHRHFLPLLPMALEQFDLRDYDLVISSESGPAKGVITSSRTCHVCYCHSPMRYIWDMYSQYRRGMNLFVQPAFSLAAHYMRMWDYAAAGRVDHFVANSNFVRGRIRKYYRRESCVIYPPVETAAGSIGTPAGDYYIAIGRLVDYKRFDLAIRACAQLGRPLRIIGDGPEYKALRREAGAGTEFLGKTSDAELRAQLAGSRALLFPGEEDFGIVPVEAQSFGRPVIAYASGGVLETVRGELPGMPMVDNPTGVFFAELSPASLADAILRFEAQASRFSAAAIREHSLQFDKAVFQRRMTEFLSCALQSAKESEGTR